MATFNQQQMNAVKKQKAFAWAKVFESTANRANDANVVIHYINAPRVNGILQKPAELPQHITNELWDMANRLNETYTCPICYDLTTRDTFILTCCGHILCKDCKDKLGTEPKCPTCRRKI